jgi:hypothetical protein
VHEPSASSKGCMTLHRKAPGMGILAVFMIHPPSRNRDNAASRFLHGLMQLPASRYESKQYTPIAVRGRQRILIYCSDDRRAIVATE